MPSPTRLLKVRRSWSNIREARRLTDLTAGFEIQLRILQALPPLFHNYASDLKGDLLAGALSICSVLQGSKTGAVNSTAAATLQQLVVSVFDKVVAEDGTADDAQQASTTEEMVIDDQTVQVREAALDAYKVRSCSYFGMWADRNCS